MNNKLIYKLFAKGILHIFQTKNYKYLYKSDINRFFLIDDWAYENLNKLRNGEMLSILDDDCFYKELKQMKLDDEVLDLPYNIRVNLNSSDNNTLETFQKALTENEKVIRCEFVINIDNHINFSDFKQYIDCLMKSIYELCLEKKVKYNMAIKADIVFFTDELLELLQKYRISPVLIMSQSKIPIDYDVVVKKRIDFIDIYKDNFDSSGIDNRLRYFTKLSKSVNDENIMILQNQLLDSIDIKSDNPILESNQNIYRLFRALTSKALPKLKLIDNNSSLNDHIPCNKCWAGSVCKHTGIYETFGSNLESSCNNKHNCIIIKQLVESIIELIHQKQEEKKENTLTKKHYSLSNGETLILVN